MKKIVLSVCIVIVAMHVNAQNEISSKEIYHYVFPEFVQGKVKMKAGEVTDALLNYNSLTEEMIFMQNDKPMALDRIKDIDTVFIENRKFIPVDQVFYEVLTNTPVALFIQHKSEVIPPGKETGFGTTQTSAASSFNDMKAGGMAYKLKLPDDYKINSKTVYWLKKDGNCLRADNVKDLQEIFPGKAIADFIKTNKIKFKNAADVVKLVEFCNQ